MCIRDSTNKVILKPLFQKKADPLTLLLKDIFKDNRNAMSYLGALSIGLGFSQTDSAIAEEDVFTIERENVITVATLEEKFVSGYHNMVEAIYFQDPLWGGDFMTEGQQPEGNEDIDIDTLTDLAEAVLKNKIH